MSVSKRRVSAAILAVTLTAFPVGAIGTASAKPSIRAQYLSLRAKAKQRFGADEVKLNLIKDGVPLPMPDRIYSDKVPGKFRPATDADLRKAIGRFRSKLNPPKLIPVVAVSSTPQTSVTSTPAPATTSGGGGGGNMAAIRQCESGGNYSTDTGNGFYGAYQFTQSTWESVGGSGNPAAASPAEQDQRAAALYAKSGSSPWPVCGR